MTLRIVHSPQEGVLRSVGDPPNGIVGFSVPEPGDSVRVIVSPTYDPAGGNGQPVEDLATELEYEEAIEALADNDAASVFYSTAASQFLARARLLLKLGETDQLALAAADLHRLREALKERFA